MTRIAERQTAAVPCWHEDIPRTVRTTLGNKSGLVAQLGMGLNRLGDSVQRSLNAI